MNIDDIIELIPLLDHRNISYQITRYSSGKQFRLNIIGFENYRLLAEIAEICALNISYSAGTGWTFERRQLGAREPVDTTVPVCTQADSGVAPAPGSPVLSDPMLPEPRDPVKPLRCYGELVD